MYGRVGREEMWGAGTEMAQAAERKAYLSERLCCNVVSRVL